MTTKPPLSGFRVLDLSRVLAGPWATQVLADLGAEVIKIERPQTGDDTRHWGPPYLRDKEGRETDTAAYYLAMNRGKASVTVDLRSTAGQSIIRGLAKKSDVLIENFKVDGLKKYGLDYAMLAPLNPKLVYCSITGFGQTGPYRHRPGYDLLIQGMGGLMSVTGDKNGAPQKTGIPVADVGAGLYAVIAIQAALLERARSGRGQYIDLSLLDVQTAMLANQAASYLAGDVIPGRLGTEHPSITPYQVFETADGHIILAVGNDRQFARFAELAGVPELAQNPLFSTNELRVRNRRPLCTAVAEFMRQDSSAGWLKRLEAAAIPSGPINNIAEVFDNPQVKQRGMRLTLSHPQVGTVDLVGNPVNFSRTPTRAETAPPALGADTEKVLVELLGYDQDTVRTLRRDGVI
ncbi:MAG: CoA transferase [Gammaproteobacteria bacterium]|nr:CoA transferase [Gammaproteobacteria bacterium]